MNKKSYSVSAIHCMHCAHTIKMELSDLAGVNDVTVDVNGQTVSIDFEAPATEQEIEDLMAEINYPVDK